MICWRQFRKKNYGNREKLTNRWSATVFSIGRLYGWNRPEKFTLYDGSFVQSGTATASSYDGKRGSQSKKQFFTSTTTLSPSHGYILLLAVAASMTILTGREWRDKKKGWGFKYLGKDRKKKTEEKKKSWTELVAPKKCIQPKSIIEAWLSWAKHVFSHEYLLTWLREQNVILGGKLQLIALVRREWTINMKIEPFSLCKKWYTELTIPKPCHMDEVENLLNWPGLCPMEHGCAEVDVSLPLPNRSLNRHLSFRTIIVICRQRLLTPCFSSKLDMVDACSRKFLYRCPAYRGIMTAKARGTRTFQPMLVVWR